MNRSTRSATAKVQDENEDGFMEDGFSVVDSDKSQKGKDGDSKNTEQKKESDKPTGKQETTPMETDQGQQEEIKENGGGNESVADASNAEKMEGEEGKATEEPKSGEEDGEAKPSEEEAQEGTNEEGKEKTEDAQQQEEGKTEKKPKHPVVWVSNISRHVKATDLKKHFSKYGKVVTAKIVTNGRSYFGYVCLDSVESAETCVKNLHNSDFEGKMINVSIDKPVRDDKILRRGRDEGSSTGGGGGHHKDPLTTVYDEEKKEKEKEKEGEEKQREEKKKHSSSANKRKIDTAKMSDEELRREISLCEREIDRLRTRLIEEQARCRAEVKRARRLERDLGDADAKIRDDRKRYERERDEWAKKSRFEQLRQDADRVILEREKDDLRRAREDFERELRRFVEDQQRANLDRPRTQSPHAHASKRFRADDSADVKSPWLSENSIPGPDASKSGSYFREGGNPNPSRGSGGQFFGGSGGNWNSSQGGSQWRSIGGSSSNQQPYFRNDTYRPGGFTGNNESGSAGFRSGPFDNTANRKF